MPLPSQFLFRSRGESSADEKNPSPQSPGSLSVSSKVVIRSLPASGLNGVSLSKRHVQMAQDLRSSIPSTCRWLGPEDLKLVGEHPMASGGSTDIWKGTYDDREVVLKSSRCSMSSDVAQAVTRLNKEVHVWCLLHCRGVDVVPLLGVYSTETRPFGLVYEYMDGLDLKQYLRNEPNVGRVKLLTAIARSLDRMHDLGIVHGELHTTNILVDKDGTVRIAGLGSASILSHSIDRTADGGENAGQLFRRRAPELIGPGVSPDVTGPAYPTKASDMYAFGVLSWEIFTGRPPFPEMTEIAATYSMLTGARPSRPNHHEISDRLWYMVERCWHSVPSKRMSAGEVVSLLEAELPRISNSYSLSRAQ